MGVFALETARPPAGQGVIQINVAMSIAEPLGFDAGPGAGGRDVGNGMLSRPSAFSQYKSRYLIAGVMR